MIDRIQNAPAGYADQAEEWKARAFEVAESTRARLSEGNALLKEFVAKKPAQALGVALGLGVVLGWLIKRR